MKEIWVNADPWDKELVTTALESGADAVIVPQERVEETRKLGLIKIVSSNGDLQWDRDVVRMEVGSSEDEDRVVAASREGKRVVVQTKDWKIIPLENLIARGGNLFVEAADEADVETASGILEKGVNGLIISHPDPLRVKTLLSSIRMHDEALELSVLTVEEVQPLGMGDRVCVDTCSLMDHGQGCLVGNSSRALFLVHAETLQNPYVEPRPFRINAGPVHAYVRVLDGKTRYLSELKAGDRVLGVDASGETMPLIVGRVKIERRPLLLIKAREPNGLVSTICQNAETVRLVVPGGEARSVVELKPGDEILGHLEAAGRHFGHRIQETITEN